MLFSDFASDLRLDGVLITMKKNSKQITILKKRIRELCLSHTAEKKVPGKQQKTNALFCHRCHNSDPSLFGNDHGLYYCRKCLDFGRLPAGVPVVPGRLSQRVWKGKPVLEFELTPLQKAASKRAVEVLKSGRDALIFAAAGAGKTEITLESICWALAEGKKVGFAISRRQVVVEIAGRLKKNFPELSVIPVCEGFTKITDADLIVCTTHQLYRYAGCFDLLILDELDAFPYAGNEVLENIAAASCRGNRLMLSATPDEKSLQEVKEGKMEIIELFSRPHGKPLCVPQIVYGSSVLLFLRSLLVLFRLVKKENKQVLYYVPRKRDGAKICRILSLFFKTSWISSSSKGKDEIMDTFRSGKTRVLVCTTLLERGITVPSVQVLVYMADHSVFTMASLIQIFGRVGRSMKDPYGVGICYCRRKSKEVERCVNQLKWMNESVGSV